MSTFRMLERKMMQRMALTDTVTDNKYIGQMMEQMRLHAQQEFEKEMKAMQAELSNMRTRMGRVEAIEADNTRLHTKMAEIKSEAQKRVEEAQRQVGEVNEKHQAIHAQHNQTISDQQTLILNLQDRIKCMEEDYSKHGDESMEYAGKSIKEMKDYMARCMSDLQKSVQSTKPAATKPAPVRVPPTINYVVEYDGAGLIRNIVAKPR